MLARLGQVFFWTACCLALAGCDQKANWRDLTGQQRTEAARQIDEAGCYQISGISGHASIEELQASAPKVLSCMRERGWEIAIGNVELRIETDGSVDLDNVHIIDMTRLQSALTALASEKPIPKLHLQVDHDKVLRFENVGAIILIVQKAGLKIGMTGYLTEPAN